MSKNNKVILAENIYNQRGSLVANKGLEFDYSLAQKIAKHKLLKPLEQSIVLSSNLNQRTSFDFFKQHLESMQVSDIVRQSGLLSDAQDIFHLLNRYPLITQKLTVLAERLPDVFGRCLSTSVLAFALCKELKKPTTTIENVFLANLLSDIGLLHIDPNVVNKKGQYNEQEWKMMQGHVVIAKHFADMVPNLPSIVSRALLEHHERLDGFGYPFGKQGSQLCEEGKIIAIVDQASALYRKLVKNGPYSWTSVLAVMQVPSSAYDPNIHRAFMRLFKRFPLEYKPAFSEDEFKQLIQVCILKRERLNLWFKEFAKIYKNHKDIMADSSDFKPLSLLHQLEQTVIASGVLSKAQHDWLTHLQTNLRKPDFIEIEEFSLVLDEVEYQCFFVMRKLVTEKEDLIKRFNGPDLPELYLEGLMRILNG
ncbi:HD-GYP domain-containing protein [Glaciecola sp. MF2-115]|uniref:HD-GYP domain-containing protein n=1 Tax=Glaciecola sp. MF2-115 TaxID=3384827 RepID=UPI0039A13FDD